MFKPRSRPIRERGEALRKETSGHFGVSTCPITVTWSCAISQYITPIRTHMPLLRISLYVLQQLTNSLIRATSMCVHNAHWIRAPRKRAAGDQVTAEVSTLNSHRNAMCPTHCSTSGPSRFDDSSDHYLTTPESKQQQNTSKPSIHFNKVWKSQTQIYLIQKWVSNLKVLPSLCLGLRRVYIM